jgi:ABC-2 type transport system permease protein
MMVIILGYAATIDVKNIKFVVCDLDKSSASRKLISRFEPTGYFTIVGFAQSQDEIIEYLDRTDATLGIVIPEAFGRKITSGEKVRIQALADGADANTASISLGYVSQIIAGYSQAILLEGLSKRGMSASVPRVIPETRVWYNPDLRSANYMVPGVVALILMIITATLTSVSLVKEKEIGTMEQLLVSPLRPWELILGKLIPFVILGFFDVLVVLSFAVFLFDIPIRGSILTLFLLSVCFVLSTLSMGLLISTISHTQQQALMTAQLFVFFPWMMLSGFTFPIENMPTSIQLLTYLIPLRYFIEIIRGLFLKGVGLDILWHQGLALLGFGVGLLTISVLRFRKRLS